MTAYRDRVRADATTRAERVHFFLSEVDLKTSNGSKVQFAKPTATSGNGADKVIDGVGSSGWSSAIGQENHLILPLADPLPANTSFSIELLFERHFVASLGRFRISATSSANQPRASKIGVEAEHILSLKETAKSRDLSALRSIYLEKVYLERPAPTHPATVQTNTRWIWNAKGNRPQETLYFSKQFQLKELPQSAEIFFTCDDKVEFFLNGHSIGSTDLWSKPPNHGDQETFSKRRKLPHRQGLQWRRSSRVDRSTFPEIKKWESSAYFVRSKLEIRFPTS